MHFPGSCKLATIDAVVGFFLVLGVTAGHRMLYCTTAVCGVCGTFRMAQCVRVLLSSVSMASEVELVQER